VYCAGFYSEKGTWSIRGTFFLRIDRATKTIVRQSFKEFDTDFITAYMTDKEEQKATKKAERKGESLEMYEYEMRDNIKREDGGAVVVAEQYYMWVETIRTTNANGSVSTRTVYHYVYNDIIVVSIAPSGDIEWNAKVPKRQHSTNDGGYYSSYAMTLKGGKIYLLFNDNGENLFLKDGDKVQQFEVTGKDALVTLATIDEDGIPLRLPQEGVPVRPDHVRLMTRVSLASCVGEPPSSAPQWRSPRPCYRACRRCGRAPVAGCHR
jgi:hypothetical protein